MADQRSAPSADWWAKLKQQGAYWVPILAPPLCAILFIVFVEALQDKDIISIVTSPMILLGLVLCTFSSRVWINFLTALACWVYVAFVLPTHLTPMQPTAWWMRAFVWFVLMVGMTSLIRHLRARSESKLRASNQALTASEARTRLTIDSASNGFIGMNSLGTITDWNKQSEIMFGFSAQEAIGRPANEIILGGRHIPGFPENLSPGASSILNRRIAFTGVHRSGSKIPVALTVYPIQTPEGLEFGAFVEDITELKHTEQIHNTQFKMTEVLAGWISVNEAAERLTTELTKGLRWSAAELWLKSGNGETLKRVHQEISDRTIVPLLKSAEVALSDSTSLLNPVWHPWSDEIKSSFFTDSAASKSFFQIGVGTQNVLIIPLVAGDSVSGFLISYPGKSLAIDDRLSVFLTSIGNSIGLFIRQRQALDRLAVINQELELKVQERTKELATAYEQAKAANRLKDEFLATVSHELRTPLGVILGHSNLLAEGGMSPEEISASIETILRNAKVQTQIISDLLDVSRIISGKMQLHLTEVDLEDSIKAATSSIQIAAAAKNIRVESNLSKDIRWIRGDADRLQQVLWNLLSNAVKFTPKNGWIRISLSESDSKAVISVADSGKGIEPNFIPFVFDRFRQEDASTTRTFGGLGLGLAIVKHLVEAHGGTVEAGSEGLNRGATFIVRIPIQAIHTTSATEKSMASQASDSPTPTIGRLSGLRVLVVDDEKDTLQMLDMILRKAGATVSTAADAKTASVMFREIRPDLILSDISMPGRDGNQFIAEIRSLPNTQGGNTPAIALSARVRDNEVREALNAGFNSHVSKPVLASDLIEALSQFKKSSH